VQDLVEHADVLILSAASEEGILAARLARPEQAIVDLTRGAVPGLVARPEAVEACAAR
jgi:hypothetical protein